jgi:uncharacterized protein (TIGR03083 family)
MQSDSDDLEALRLQLDDLLALVGQLQEDDFGRPTRCPGWTVAELVAHCEGMLVRLVGDNARSVGGTAEIDRVGYYRYEPDGPREAEGEGRAPGRTFSEVIRDRVIDEVGGRRGPELRSSLDAAVASALLGMQEIPPDLVIHRSGHPKITYGEFVASRNLEFGVHTMDIAHATGRPERAHPAAAAIITGILDGLLGASPPHALGWDATTYILTGTGRRQLGADERATLGPLAARFPLLR